MIGNQKVVQADSHEDEALERVTDRNKKLAKYSLDATFYSSNSVTTPDISLKGFVYWLA